MHARRRRGHQVLARVHVLEGDRRSLRLAGYRAGRGHHEHRRPPLHRLRGQHPPLLHHRTEQGSHPGRRAQGAHLGNRGRPRHHEGQRRGDHLHRRRDRGRRRPRPHRHRRLHRHRTHEAIRGHLQRFHPSGRRRRGHGILRAGHLRDRVQRRHGQ